MAEFFKKFGKGILYIFVLPFLLLVLALYGLYSIGGFIFLFIKSIILFFRGRSLHEDLPEDIKAKAILDARAGNNQEEENVQIKEEEKTEPFSVYQPIGDPFMTPSANKDPIQEEKVPVPQSIEEAVFGKEEVKEVKRALLEADVNFKVVKQFVNTVEEIVEEPVQEEIPNIPEVENISVNEEEHFEEISTDFETNKYQPRGEEEYELDDDNDDDDNGIGLSFDE